MARADGQGNPSPGKKANDQSTMSITGYAQVDYLVGTASPAPGQLIERRARVTLSGKSRDRLEGKVQYAFDRLQPAFTDIFLTGYTPDLSLQVGQFEVPMSEEIMTSATKYVLLENAPVANYLWPRERDRLANLTYRPRDTHGTQVAAGVMLGNGINAWDNNPNKDVLVRVKQFLDGGRGSVFAGSQVGAFTDGNGITTPRRIYGGGAQWQDRDKDWKLNTETWVGQSHGAPFAGGLVRGIRDFHGGKCSVLAHVDYFDPDTTAGGDALVGPVLGYTYRPSTDVKLMLELDGRQSQATAGSDFGVGFRCQVEFD